MRLGVLLVAAACLSCAAPVRPVPATLPLGVLPERAPVWIDARFPLEDRDHIEAALARWNRALGGSMEYFLASDDLERPRDLLQLGGGPVVWGVTFTYNAQTPAGVPDTYLAQVFGDNDVQFYGDHMAAYGQWETVALHEIGHTLGLPDNPPGARLMTRPLTAGAECIDRGTLNDIAVRHPAWAGALRPECP
jgi:hypothetical protein